MKKTGNIWQRGRKVDTYVCLCVCGMSQKPRKEYFKERVINNIECQSEMKKDEDEKTFI